jgi:hypothetical protein
MYLQKWIHSALGYLTPTEFASQLQKQQRIVEVTYLINDFCVQSFARGTTKP